MILSVAVMAATEPSRDYYALAVTAALGALTAGVTAFGIWAQFVYKPRARTRDDVLEGVRHQVQNSHKTNLREDLDKVIHTVSAVALSQRTLVETVNTIRDDATTSREDNAGLHRAVTALRKEISDLRSSP